MNFKSKLVSSIATMSLAAALVGGATFAWFTASASNDNNQFTAGTVILGVYDNATGLEKTTPMFELDSIAPGDSGSYDLKVKNTGSLELKYKMILNANGGLFAAPYPVTVKVFNGSTEITNLGLRRTLASGSSETLTVKWEFPQDAGDQYQGATGSFGLTFDGIQTKYTENL